MFVLEEFGRWIVCIRLEGNLWAFYPSEGIKSVWKNLVNSVVFKVCSIILHRPLRNNAGGLFIPSVNKLFPLQKHSLSILQRKVLTQRNTVVFTWKSSVVLIRLVNGSVRNHSSAGETLHSPTWRLRSKFEPIRAYTAAFPVSTLRYRY